MSQFYEKVAAGRLFQDRGLTHVVKDLHMTSKRHKNSGCNTNLCQKCGKKCFSKKVLIAIVRKGFTSS